MNWLSLTSQLSCRALLLGGLWAGAIQAQNQPETEKDASESPASEEALVAMGYAMGSQIGLQVGFSDDEIDLILKGMRMAARNEERPENFEKLMPEAQKFFLEKRRLWQAEEEKRRDAQAAENAKAAESFFAALDEKPDIEKSATGLRYKIAEAGAEKKPGEADVVKVHYHGTLIDGTVFDSSRDRGQPASFALNRVVPGFREGLQLLGEGGKATLYIPSDLGYGNRPRPGGVIKPGDALIFEVELIEITEGAQQQIPPRPTNRTPPKLPPNLKPPPLPENLKPPPPPPNVRPKTPPPSDSE